MTDNRRLLFFDLLRVLAVLLIVLRHISSLMNEFYPFNLMFGLKHVYYVSMGGLGVSILLFVSGAVLEYRKTVFRGYRDIIDFYKKRFWRIYPAYWLTLIPGTIFIILFTHDWSVFDLIMQYSGFNAFIGRWGGSINAVGWFVGLIIVLYMLYPFLSRLSSKNPFVFLIGALVISRIFYFIFSYYHIGNSGQRWFPLCNLSEFCLGITLVQTGLFPKAGYSWKPLMIAGDLSFYVFLVHLPILRFAKYGLNLYLYLFSMICLAVVLWRVDILLKPAIVKTLPSIFKRYLKERAE